MNMHQQAVQAGFKGAIGNSESGYVLLTEHTNGQSGRRIYIHASLAPKFAALVEESKQNLVLIQLSQLRAIAAGGTSYTNLADAKEHKTRIGDLEVTYTVTQQVIDGLQPGVRITDIEYGWFGRGNLPGLYRVKNERERWILGDSTERIETQNAAINGLADNLEVAAREIMPPMVEHAYGGAGASEGVLYENGFTLFYYPQSIKIAGKHWKTPEQKQVNHKHCASKLANAMLESQRRGQKVQWTVHGVGSNLLKSALQQLAGQKLDNHDVMFMAPDELVTLLPLVKKAGMGLHPKVMHYSEAEVSVAKFKNESKYAAAIADQLKQFGPKYHSRASLLKAKALDKGTGLVVNAAVTYLTWGAGTMYQAALALPKNGIRNTAASLCNVSDHSLNPHLNPHLCQAGFNLHAKERNGGVAASYAKTFKAILAQVKRG